MNQFVEYYKQMIAERLSNKQLGETEPYSTFFYDSDAVTYSLRLAIATIRFNQELGKTIFLLDDEEVLDDNPNC